MRSAKLEKVVLGKMEISQALGLPQESLHSTGMSEKQLGVTHVHGWHGRLKGEKTQKERIGARKEGQNPPPKQRPSSRILESRFSGLCLMKPSPKAG